MFDFFAIKHTYDGFDPLTSRGITLLLSISIAILVRLYFTTKYSYWKSRGVPYDEPVFLLGNLWDVVRGKRQIAQHLGHLYTKFDAPYFGMYILGKPFLVLRDPDLIKAVTIKDFSSFDERSVDWEKTPDALAGRSLVTMKNPEWKNVRGKLSGIFTSGKLKQSFPSMKFDSEDMQDYLTKIDGEAVLVKDIASKYMTDILGAFLFGFETNAFQEKGADFSKNINKMYEMTPVSVLRMFTYLLAPEVATWLNLEFMDSTYLQSVFLNTLEERQKTKAKRNDFVDHLLKLQDNDSGTTFDTRTMMTQAVLFFFWGFETTHTIASYALYELCLRPDCQDKLREEIKQSLNPEVGATFETLENMKYLDLVVLETLRRYPVSLFLNRRCTKDYEVASTGFVIEKGTSIFIPVDGIHNNPKYYPEPDKFIPERFEEKKKAYSQSCVFMPFGLGPRQCLGNRFAMIATKAFIVNVLQKFELERCAETPVSLTIDTKSPFYQSREPLKMILKSCGK